MDVNITPFEIETKARHGDMVRADVYLPRNRAGPFPVLLEGKGRSGCGMPYSLIRSISLSRLSLFMPVLTDPLIGIRNTRSLGTLSPNPWDLSL